MSRLSAVTSALPVLTVLAVAALTGCGVTDFAPGTPAPTTLNISGNVHGGQPPVTGSHVYLYAVGTSGYGSASTSLLTGSNVTVDGSGHGYVTTDSNGNFTISGDYASACTGQQTYMLAVGGNPGLTTGTNNSAITLIAALGNCSNLTTSSVISITELSTAAAVTALQQFMTDSTHIGSSSTNSVGIANAMLSVANISDLATSNARSTNLIGNGSVPQAKLNTIADILAPCVNSVSPASPACVSLFAAATPTGGTAPTDVASAMLSIAKNPGSNTGTLFTLINSSAPFQPALSAAPNDYSIGVTYSGSGLIAPGAVAIDFNGAAFTASCPNCPNRSSGTVSGVDALIGFGPQGFQITGASGPGLTTDIHVTQGIAFALDGALWSVNDANGSGSTDQVVRETEGGVITSGFPYSTSISTPAGIAIDAGNSAWVTNFSANTAVRVSSSGSLGATASSPGFSIPEGIGIDNNGLVFAAGAGSSSILKFNSSGVVQSGSGAGYTGAGLAQPIAIAIDNADRVWTIDNATNKVSVINGTTGTDATGSSGYSAGLYQASVIAIDGLGTAWIANCRAGCSGSGSTAPDNVIHLSATGAVINPSDGLQDTHFNGVGTAAIDASGNLWVSNNAGGSLTELLGVAAPVRTPLSLAAATNLLGVRP